MFEPKTYWEQRAALNEALSHQLLTLLEQVAPDAVKGFAENWMMRQDAIKRFEVDRVLGPSSNIPSPTQADENWINVIFQINFGRFFSLGVNLFEADPSAIGSNREDFDKWVEALPELTESLNPSQPPQFYRESSQDPNSPDGVIFAFTHGGMLYAMTSGNYTHIQQISLAHLPSDFTWGTPYFRNEFFGYRSDLDRGVFVQALSEAIRAQTPADEVRYYDVSPEVIRTFRDVPSIDGQAAPRRIDFIEWVPKAVVVEPQAEPVMSLESLGTGTTSDYDKIFAGAESVTEGNDPSTEPANDNVTFKRGETSVVTPIDEFGYTDVPPTAPPLA